MYQDKSFLCIIPAREGSKGIPNKNITLIDGKPMIAYVIEAARQSGVFDKIVVTTDSDKIASVSEVYSAEIIRRPSELSGDEAVVEDAMVHALNQLPKYDYVLLLEPTSPMIIGRDILLAAKKIIESGADMVVSVCKATPEIVTTGQLGENGSMRGFLPKELRQLPRQKRPEYYYLNSAIYLGKWFIWAGRKDYYDENVVALIMHPDDSVHIDTYEDLYKAERAMKRRKWAKKALA